MKAARPKAKAVARTVAKAKVKSPARKTATKKPATKKAAGGKGAKAPARKGAAKKTAAKKAVKAATRSPAAKPATRKAAAKTPAARKPVASKSTARKPVAKTPVAVKAAPKQAPVAAAPPPPQWPPLVMEVLKQLDDSKAEQVVTIDVSRKSTVADVMVVASGRSNRHVSAIADQVVERLEQMGKKNLRVEGMPQCDWVLVDAGDVMVHVFRPEVRSFYNLEKLWSEHAPA